MRLERLVTEQHGIDPVRLVRAHRREALLLRGTPVTDAVFKSLSRFPKLQYIDVVDTSVTAEGLGAFASKRPGLRFHPRRPSADSPPSP
jgi:hypothetical protein